MAPNDLSRLISQMATVFKGNHWADELWFRVTTTISTTIFSEERDIATDLSESDRYLFIFAEALEYSVSPTFVDRHMPAI